MANISELAQNLVDLNEEKVYELVDRQIEEGIKPVEIIKELNTGMTIIGERFSNEEYFINELMYSGEIMKNIMEKLNPLIVVDKSEEKAKEKVVIGTVKGDIHDVGKNIVVMMLQGSGFDVIDLGINVSTETFVEKVQETGAKVVGLSALLNFVFFEMKNVVEALKDAGIRDQVKVVIGGAPCNEEVKEFTGADYYAKDAGAGVAICKEIYGL